MHSRRNDVGTVLAAGRGVCGTGLTRKEASLKEIDVDDLMASPIV